MSQLEDDKMVTAEDFHRHETSKKIPVGWIILFVVLVIWGIYYLINYLPVISGWTQYSTYEQQNVVHK